jgi:hypothetical protein
VRQWDGVHLSHGAGARIAAKRVLAVLQRDGVLPRRPVGG